MNRAISIRETIRGQRSTEVKLAKVVMPIWRAIETGGPAFGWREA